MSVKEKKQTNSTFLRLLKYAKSYIPQLTVGLLLVLSITALDLYRPTVIGAAIDLFAEGGEMHEIAMLAIKYGVTIFIMFALNAASAYLIAWTGQTIIYNVRQEVFQHIQSLSLRFFDITPVGKIVTRVTNDVEALNEMFTSVIINLIKNSIKIVGLATVMLIYNWKLALLGFALLPVVCVLTYFFRKIAHTTYRIVRTKLTALNTYLSEHLSGMRVIQVFAKEETKNNEFNDRCEDYFHASFRELMVFAIFRPLIYLLSVIALVTILGAGGVSVLNGTITVGVLYIFTNYISSFFEPIQELAEQFGTLQQSLASAEKIFTILDDRTMIMPPEEPVHIENLKGRIEFKNVWFAYSGEDWILKDVSFVIEPGTSAAFVGATGAGKSSILNLIGRYYDIQKGSITIDGVDIKDISMDELRRGIGQVQQDVFLFTGDVKGNIRLRSDEISDEVVKEAAKNVNADRFIDKLPHGYDEYVTERGSTFSAGERQLISFARTLAYDPKILVLDEATANIDTETESLIQDALKTLMKGRTTIMVAHRLSTIQHADKIMVMDNGRLMEQGTHQELIALEDGIYKKLYEIQLEQ
ncbi:MAG: ABC transporter ATP-binding protein/permease [Lachnospiraceae bacterium]|nr:ABC transporter ATP-binding protein/permease [Lachnospiraceae bacterium]